MPVAGVRVSIGTAAIDIVVHGTAIDIDSNITLGSAQHTTAKNRSKHIATVDSHNSVLTHESGTFHLFMTLTTTIDITGSCNSFVTYLAVARNRY